MRQFAQYVCVGGLAFGVDIAALFLLTEKVGFHYISSASIAFVLGLATNYILCVAVVFDYRALQNRAHEFVIFSLIGVAGLLLFLLGANTAIYFATGAQVVLPSSLVGGTPAKAGARTCADFPPSSGEGR